MPVSILTDSSVQFPNPVFEGRTRVTILPTKWEDAPKADTANDLKAADLPQSLNGFKAPNMGTTSIEEYQDNFERLGPHCDGILAILNSAHFNENTANAQAAAEAMQGSVPIKIVDSNNISLGLGMLVQLAAEAAEEGLALTELELSIRSLIPRIYTVLCIPGLSYLERRGLVNVTQALVGEHLGMLPVFTLDSGELVHSEKARNKRHLVDILHEFLTEFGELEHISLLQGTPSFEQETRALRERLAEDHADTPISEQIIDAQMASIIGPHSVGVFALQAA